MSPVMAWPWTFWSGFFFAMALGALVLGATGAAWLAFGSSALLIAAAWMVRR